LLHFITPGKPAAKADEVFKLGCGGTHDAGQDGDVVTLGFPIHSEAVDLVIQFHPEHQSALLLSLVAPGILAAGVWGWIAAMISGLCSTILLKHDHPCAKGVYEISRFISRACRNFQVDRERFDRMRTLPKLQQKGTNPCNFPIFIV
jgi:hypothetical protein